jgi:hypothetical protein
MTPVEVRDALVNSGFDLSAYSNPLAAIHTILKRLTKTEDVRPAIIDGDQTVYQWKGIRRFPREGNLIPRVEALAARRKKS